MRKDSEIFRVLIGLTSDARDLNDELTRTRTIRAAVLDTLKPLKLTDRLSFQLFSCPRERKQWLIVSMAPSLQLPLFREIERIVGPSGTHDSADSVAAQKSIGAAFGRLQTLAHTARWHPDQFFDLLDSGSSTKEIRSAADLSYDGRSAEMQGPDGSTKRALVPQTSRRHTRQVDVDVSFRVKLVGDGVAVVSPSRVWRKTHRTTGKHIHLGWMPFEHPAARDFLYQALCNNQSTAGVVRLTLNRNGEVCALELRKL